MGEVQRAIYGICEVKFLFSLQIEANDSRFGSIETNNRHFLQTSFPAARQVQRAIGQRSYQ